MNWTDIYAVPKGKKNRRRIATTNEPVAGFFSGQIKKKYLKKGYTKFKTKSRSK
jgi:hypothetical protein